MIPAPPCTDRQRGSVDGVDFGLRELMAVREIVHAFLTADRPEEVFQFALDRVSPLVGATFACVYLVDGASELMRLVAAHNWPERFAQFLGEMRVRVGFGPSGEAASERRAIEVPDVFADIEGLTYLRGVKLSALLSAEKTATEYALARSGRPSVTVRFDAVDAESVGAFIFLYEFVTSLMGELLDVDAYDQPAVELGKQAAFARLGRAGHEGLSKALQAAAETDEEYLV